MSSRLERVDPSSVASAAPAMVAMEVVLAALYAEVPLASLSWARDSDADNYTLLVTARDGRTYESVVSFDALLQVDVEPVVSTNTGRAQWRQTDVLLLRQLIDSFIQIRNSVAATVIDIAWIPSPSPAVQVTATPGSVAPGAPVTAGWAAPAAAALDWIGVYATGADVHSYLAYAYVGAQVLGAHTFAAPATPGTYELRYLLNNGYVSVATSVAFTVA